MDEFIYLEEGEVRVSDMAMEIPEFKAFKRYDTSTNKTYFKFAMSYIFYVYKVFGEKKSYLYNQPLQQRKRNAVQHHTGSYKKISDFDSNEWVAKCVTAYLTYSRTANERLFDALKDDIERFIEVVEKTPHTYEKVIKVYRLDPERDDGTEIGYDVKIDVPNVTGRIETLKKASDLNDLFLKKLADVNKDADKKKSSGMRLFEDVQASKNIPLTTIPKADK